MSSPPVCLVFGATGQDGRLVGRRFARGGYAVVGVSRRPPADARRDLGDYRPCFAGMVGDFLASADATAELLGALQPAIIVNVAGMSSVGASFERPMETLLDNGNLNLFILEALRREGSRARYVFASSGEVFGETPAAGAAAGTPWNPRSPYAVSKASAAMMLRNYRDVFGVDAALAHLFPHESPLRPSHFVLPKLARSLVDLRAGRLRCLRLGRTDVVRDWGWAEEYMDALYRQARLPVPVDLVLATGSATSLNAMVDHGMRRLGIAAEGRLAVDPAMVRPADLARSTGDPRETWRAIGWRATCAATAVLDRLIDHAVAAAGEITPPPRRRVAVPVAT
ncbi:GDP-mannose 4,6-dehydratase [Stella sp.]|uniref:GDP-mannose 4,6-dehydratase n=1 Tax=Stella sp. TaxID=2912054 RepID=UPI0035AFAC6E